MISLTLVALLATLLYNPTVQGGNPSWESSIQFTGPHDLPNFVPLLAENSTGVTTNLLAKRGTTFRPGVEAADIHLWPNKEIVYCFEDKVWPEKNNRRTKEIVYNSLIEARDLWYRSGLPEDFKWTELSPAECASRDRNKYLLIEFNLHGVLSTSIGMQPSRSTALGPTMKISDQLNVGMLNVVSNYAHEMGHSWGLYHEHQNPAFWKPPYAHSGGKDFGPDQFNCHNLKDYDSTVERIRSATDIKEWEVQKNIKKACEMQTVAKALKFLAADYLPFPAEELIWDSGKEIDWDSIMLYPSGAGGKGDASPGNDNRAPVLLGPGGQRIKINLKPSSRDVYALRRLYSASKRKLALLHLDLRSYFKNKFDKIRKKDEDSGCN